MKPSPGTGDFRPTATGDSAPAPRTADEPDRAVGLDEAAHILGIEKRTLERKPTWQRLAGYKDVDGRVKFRLADLLGKNSKIKEIIKMLGRMRLEALSLKRSRITHSSPVRRGIETVGIEGIDEGVGGIEAVTVLDPHHPGSPFRLQQYRA